MKIINITGVDVPIISGPKGICMSGGADSSLLLYILLRYSSTPLYIFTLAKNSNRRASAVVSSKVIEQCIQLTNNSNIIHYVYYTDTQDNLQLFSTPANFYNNGIIDCFYTALTLNPPTNIANNFCGEENNTQDKARNPNIIHETEHTTICGFNAKVYTPFININKIKIAEMYKDLDILDKIFPVSRSCEAENRLNYYDHCGECWWCKEREWGFSKLI